MSWSRWKPTAEQPWDLTRVAHLHRRAGFAANWSTLQASLAEGVESSVGHILNPVRTAQDREFELLAETISDAAIGAESAQRLRAWWVYRMIKSPSPLVERLTLLWHNHFATSNDKVDNVAAMFRQNQVLREHCRGRFGDLLEAVLKDPAILIWLDAPSNRRAHPNQNLSRELLELFTLGEGNYTEQDVVEAARCLAGWSVAGGRFRFVPEHQDDGVKTILGTTGNVDGDALLALLLKQEATSKRVAWRICQMFFGEGVVSDRALDELAAELHRRELDIGWAVERILRSELFFSDANIRSRISSPTEYVIGAIRSLDMNEPIPSTLLVAAELSTQGQDLFHPPTVFGWPGGRSWINTRSIIARGNFATALVFGRKHLETSPVNVHELADRHGFGQSTERIIEFYSKLILGHTKANRKLRERLDRTTDTHSGLRQAVAMLLASPESYLC